MTGEIEMARPDHDAARQATRADMTDAELRKRHRENQVRYFESKTMRITEHFGRYHQAYLKAYGETLQSECSKPPEKMLKRLGELAGLQAGDNLLDCGSGMGYPASFLSEAFRCNALGLNITDCQLHHSQKYKTERCNFIRHDFNDLALVPVPFQPDKIFFLEAFGYAEDPAELLGECAALLPDGGRVLVKSAFAPRPEDASTLKEVEEFYAYSFWPLAKIFQWACEAGLVPTLCIKTAFGAYDTTHKFWDLIGREFRNQIRLIPYVLVLEKITEGGTNG